LYQIQLVDERGRVLAVVPTLFAEGWNEAILQRILNARQYPFYFEDGRYGFRCYSTVNGPLYVPPPADECPPATGLIQVEAPGEIIWESVHDYATLDEAKCVFDVFKCLLKDKENIQRIQDSHCGLYGLELTHPHEVLAEHPQRYQGRTDLEAAMERTRACINAEGFHLVEHILLRPKRGTGKHITLQFRVPDDAAVCRDEDENGEVVEVPVRPHALLDTIYCDAAQAEPASKS
jgi:hypothetical protein